MKQFADDNFRLSVIRYDIPTFPPRFTIRYCKMKAHKQTQSVKDRVISLKWNLPEESLFDANVIKCINVGMYAKSFGKKNMKPLFYFPMKAIRPRLTKICM